MKTPEDFLNLTAKILALLETDNDDEFDTTHLSDAFATIDNLNDIDDIPYTMAFLQSFRKLQQKCVVSGLPGMPHVDDLERYEKNLKKMYIRWSNNEQNGFLTVYCVIKFSKDLGIAAPICLELEDDPHLIPLYHIGGKEYSEDVKKSVLDAIEIVRYYCTSKIGILKKDIETALKTFVIQWENSLFSKFSDIKGKSFSLSFSILIFLGILRKLTVEKKIIVKNKSKKKLTAPEINVPSNHIFTGLFDMNQIPDKTLWTTANYKKIEISSVEGTEIKLKAIQDVNEACPNFFNTFVFRNSENNSFVNDSSKVQIKTIETLDEFIEEHWMIEKSIEINLELVKKICFKHEGKFKQEILQTMEVPEKKYSDKIIDILKEYENKKQEMQTLEDKELSLYLNYERRYLGELPPILETLIDEKKILLDNHAFLIAKKLIREIKNNNHEIFQYKPFIFPIHQYLSQLILESKDENIIKNLMTWLSSKNIYSTSRDFAAFQLGMTKSQNSKEILLDAISDSSNAYPIRLYSIYALGMIAAQDTINILTILYANEADLQDCIAHTIYFICKKHQII